MTNEMNSHLIDFTDTKLGRSMISIKGIDGVFPNGDGALIQYGGTDFFAEESAAELIEKISDLQRVELLKLEGL